MVCRAETTAIQEKPFLVNLKEFINFVDQADLECREVHNIQDFYKSDWFDQTRQIFTLPTFCLKSGCIKECINGRHRTALLVKHHVDPIPISFIVFDDNGWAIDFFNIDEASKHILRKMEAHELSSEDVFFLPDLPIEKQ